MFGRKKQTGWVGWIYFAAAMLFISGGLSIIAGLTGIFNSDFYVATQTGQLLAFNYTTWGWIHLVLGVGVLALGWYVIKGKLWAHAITIGLVAVMALINLASIGTYPLWSITGLIINGFIIYALTLHGEEVG